MEKYINFPSILLAVGFCKSGKTYSVQYTLRTCKKFDMVIVVSATAQFTDDYKYLEEIGVKHKIYNTSKIEEIMTYLMNKQQEILKMGQVVEVALILDDCMGSLNDSKVFKKLTSCFRHFHISIIVLTQYCNNQTTYVRELANYIYCFDQRTEQSKKAIYNAYFGDVGSYKEFKTKFENIKPYQFWFIDRIKKYKTKLICPAQQVVVRKKIADVKTQPDEKEKFIQYFRD